MIVQFIWHKFLQAYSNNQESIVGTTISGRDLPVYGIEESVGLYINTLPLIIDWDNDNSVIDQMQQIQDKITEMNTNGLLSWQNFKRMESVYSIVYLFLRTIQHLRIISIQNI